MPRGRKISLPKASPAKALLAALPDMIFRVDADGWLLQFEPGRRVRPAIPPEEFLGRKVTDTLPKRVAVPMLSHIKESALSKEPRVFTYQLPRADGIHVFEARFEPFGSGEVIVIVRDATPAAASTLRARSYGLTPREMQVLRLATQGLTDKEVASQLKISQQTARGHLANIRRKMGARSRTEASVRAIQEGLFDEAELDIQELEESDTPDKLKARAKQAFERDAASLL